MHHKWILECKNNHHSPHNQQGSQGWLKVLVLHYLVVWLGLERDLEGLELLQGSCHKS